MSNEQSSESERFARAILYNLTAHYNRTGKRADCVIVATEEMLQKVDHALLTAGISLNAIIDEELPRRSIIFCNEADLDLFA